MQVSVTAPFAAQTSSDSLKRLAVTTEDLGYDGIALTEHIVVPLHIESRHPYAADGKVSWDHDAHWLQAMVALGFIAGLTERIRLITTVIPVMTRDPLSLAKEAATVDVLSNGRLELGLGAGWCHEEAAALGHASDHPNGRLEETLDILRLAWGQSSFSYRGRYYDFEEVGVHPQPSRGVDTPIWIGGLSPRLVRLTKRKADGSIISARRHMLPEIRAALVDKKIMVTLPIASDFDTAEVLERASALREQGTDEIALVSPRADYEVAIDAIERFAKQLLPELHAGPRRPLAAVPSTGIPELNERPRSRPIASNGIR
jgi:probable F420-dependent oxidoreductase